MFESFETTSINSDRLHPRMEVQPVFLIQTSCQEILMMVFPLERPDVLDTQLRFSIRHYCYGSVGMTKEWLLYDNTTSAEVVVEMMFHSMPKDLYEILL